MICYSVSFCLRYEYGIVFLIILLGLLSPVIGLIYIKKDNFPIYLRCWRFVLWRYETYIDCRAFFSMHTSRIWLSVDTISLSSSWHISPVFKTAETVTDYGKFLINWCCMQMKSNEVNQSKAFQVRFTYKVWESGCGIECTAGGSNICWYLSFIIKSYLRKMS